MAGTLELNTENYAFLQRHIYEESGIVLDGDKGYLLEARLMPIARRRGARTLDDLCALMRVTSGAVLRREVVEAMTTNETLFFRDLAPFEALKKEVLPALLDLRRTMRKLSFWCAACSFGQEPYSLAMMLLEMGLADWRIEILGTDLAGTVLDRARQGRYMQIEVNRGLPAPLLIKYFARDGLDWQLKEQVRRMVRFEARDLRRPMRDLGPFDVVLCRNVLIYFDVETKRKILGEIRGTLHHGGHLILGAAETTLNIDDSYLRRPFGTAVFYQAP